MAPRYSELRVRPERFGRVLESCRIPADECKSHRPTRPRLGGPVFRVKSRFCENDPASPSCCLTSPAAGTQPGLAADTAGLIRAAVPCWPCVSARTACVRLCFWQAAPPPRQRLPPHCSQHPGGENDSLNDSLLLGRRTERTKGKQTEFKTFSSCTFGWSSPFGHT